MKIRKNRTSSRVAPEFSLSHVVGKVENCKRDEAAAIKIDTILQPPYGKQPLEADELDVAAILNSLDTEPANKIKIRDFVLTQGDIAGTPGGGSQNYNCIKQVRQFGSESDTRYPKVSRKRIADELMGGRQSKSSSVSSDKIYLNTTPRMMKEEMEPGLAKSEVIDDPSQMTAEVSNLKAVGRKRPRRHHESDSRMVIQEEVSTKSSSTEDGDEDLRYLATAEKMSATTQVAKVEEMETESTEKCHTSSFPMGWSYRGLAQIAEHDKATPGKQCGRTDGRSWRCPLKVQEGYTLCEHHLSKFRLKKLGKGNKKQQQQRRKSSSPPQQQCRQPQQATIAEAEAAEASISQIEISRASPRPTTTPTTSSTNSLEHDAPTKFRRRHKTVKLSGL